MEQVTMEKTVNEQRDPLPMRSIVVVCSWHHKNTEKIARSIATVLGAEVKMPREIRPVALGDYDLAGFGSGIYGAQNHESLLDLADTLPHADGRKAFIFSTYGAPEALYKGERLREFIRDNHAALREKLQSRGYTVIGEFACPGLNTNSFLKYFGGLNKGRPDAEDLRHAEEFAENLKRFTRIEKTD